VILCASLLIDGQIFRNDRSTFSYNLVDGYADFMYSRLLISTAHRMPADVSVHEPVVSFSPQKYIFEVFQKPTVEIKDL